MSTIYSLSFQEQKKLAHIINSFFFSKTASHVAISSGIIRIIRAARGVSKRKLEKLNYQEGVSLAYITAFRQDKSIKENKKRNSDMIRSLQKSGVRDYYTIQGRYEEEKLVPYKEGDKLEEGDEIITDDDGNKVRKTKVMVEEQTFLLVNPDIKAVMDAAHKYDQDSIIYKGKDNVVGMYNRLNNSVTIAAPGTEGVSVKDDKADGGKAYDEAYTRFRNIGLNYDFKWGDSIEMDMKNPQPVTVKDLKDSGWLERQGVSEKDFNRKPESTYQEKKRDRGDKVDRDVERRKFLKTKVINPDTGNEVQISTLKNKPADSQAYQYYLRLKDDWERSL